ncbi:MAG TPA: hypothetical protein VFQ44_30935 [Streptosporangiaceae bacterium]|nr:hypothetical protein [Streptosporangiaceae bacterium]
MACLTSEIHFTAAQMTVGSRLPGGRMDPSLLLTGRAITRFLGHHASVVNAVDGLDQQVATITSQIAGLVVKAAAGR